MQEMKWWQLSFIGAIGGPALAVLKLIEAKFFLSSAYQIEAYVGYLTYFCYMLLGSLAAVFLADHELPPTKVRRSAFILGLLAPSVLLAIANQPIRTLEAEESSRAIPNLSWVPLSGAYAGPLVKVPLATPNNSIAVQRLQSSSLRPTFTNAFSAAVGRGELKQPYAYVLGSTSDKSKAIGTALKIQTILGDTSLGSSQARVIQVDEGKKYFVVLGDLTSKQELSKLRTSATSTAIGAIGVKTGTGTLSLDEKKYLADLLANAPVVPASELAEEK